MQICGHIETNISIFYSFLSYLDINVYIYSLAHAITIQHIHVFSV